MISLANALTRNTWLSELDHYQSSHVTIAGVHAFLTVLQNPNTSLGKLYLSGTSINDQVIVGQLKKWKNW
jgi:hypothetical protein